MDESLGHRAPSDGSRSVAETLSSGRSTTTTPQCEQCTNAMLVLDIKNQKFRPMLSYLSPSSGDRSKHSDLVVWSPEQRASLQSTCGKVPGIRKVNWKTSSSVFAQGTIHFLAPSIAVLNDHGKLGNCTNWVGAEKVIVLLDPYDVTTEFKDCGGEVTPVHWQSSSDYHVNSRRETFMSEVKLIHTKDYTQEMYFRPTTRYNEGDVVLLIGIPGVLARNYFEKDYGELLRGNNLTYDDYLDSFTPGAINVSVGTIEKLYDSGAGIRLKCSASNGMCGSPIVLASNPLLTIGIYAGCNDIGGGGEQNFAWGTRSMAYYDMWKKAVDGLEMDPYSVQYDQDMRTKLDTK